MFLSTTSQPQRLTSATILWLTPTLFIAFAIASGILSDWLFARIDARLVLVATLAELGAAILLLRRARRIEIERDDAELFGFAALVVIVAAYLIYPALPGWLPPARHFDAVNHVVHAQFIYEANALPRDFSGNVPPYYMSGYPAGGALLGALVAHWLGALPIQTIHPVIAIILALAAGLTFLFTYHALRTTQSTARAAHHAAPISFLSTFFLFTAWAYFPGSVNERYFYAQNLAQYFALATFYFAYRYFHSRDIFWLALMPLSISLVLVSHPTPIVAPLLASLIAILASPHTHLQNKLAHAIILALGLVPIAIIYVIPHLSLWVALTGYGEASPFDVESIGWILPALSLAGLALAARQESRASFGLVALFALSVLAQPAALFAARFFLPQISPYYFEKSVYLLVYPLAMLSALPLAHLSQFVRVSARAFWLGALGFALLVFIFLPPRPFAPLTLNEFRVAQWAKENLGAQNIAVVSGIREDAYWVQWTMLGNAPFARATAGAYHLGSMTYAEWRGNPREPDYAIVRNLARIPRDPTAQTLVQIGESALLKKPRAEILAALSPKRKTNFKVEDLFELVGYDSGASWRAGAPLALTLYWQTIEWATTRTRVFVQIVDARGNVAARDEREMFSGIYPTHRWPLGVTLPDTFNFTLPVEAIAGDYRIEIVLYSQLTGARLSVWNAGETRDQIDLGDFRVE